MNLENKLKEYFGFDQFREGQKEVIEKVMDGKSVAAIFPTGAGKSLCYQLPSQLLEHMTLVVSPLLSLMKDQLDFLKSHNIKAARLDSSLSKEEYTKILEEARLGKLKVLMISVERFKNERFRSHLKRMKISMLVVDEAHCISEWGHNFRPEYLNIPSYKKQFDIPQVLLLTATATTEVALDMCAKLDVAKSDIINTGFYRKNLNLSVVKLINKNKNETLFNLLKSSIDAPTIVYVTLQKTAENVASYLESMGVNVSHYHAGLKTEQREQIQNRFMGDSLHCIVATIAFGMGIDKGNIRRVIHYDLPKSLESYSQEIGRAGRDGLNSDCYLLACKDSINILENFIYGDTPDKKSIETLLDKIQNYEQKLLEIKTYDLVKELNIRNLPLKTLLVYLGIDHLISPKYTYFEDYTYKYLVEKEQILNLFDDRRKSFIKNIFDNSLHKKIWSTIDMNAISQNSGDTRDKVITALEYLNEKSLIELQSKSAVEVYEILSKDFDVIKQSEKIYQLFVEKQDSGIKKIHDLLAFFEGSDCLSIKLASYFSQEIELKKCGHCSVCENGAISFSITKLLKSIDEYDFNDLTLEIITNLQEQKSVSMIVKFLCGLESPLFTKIKAKKLQYFGILESYSVKDVEKKVLEIWS
ncbi:MAG: recombinase RecQ [Candidatus Cloacimonadota bacterium]|nr:MAG: recombinase RecQ [Candidatus Cloacimonadota bacterium]